MLMRRTSISRRFRIDDASTEMTCLRRRAAPPFALLLLTMLGLAGCVSAPSAVDQARFQEGKRLYRAADYPAAAAVFRPLAEEGLNGAQMMLAMSLLRQGPRWAEAEGPIDPVQVTAPQREALRWFERAARDGDERAQRVLDNFAERGLRPS
jgi:TPR repeat protein